VIKIRAPSSIDLRKGIPSEFINNLKGLIVWFVLNVNVLGNPIQNLLSAGSKEIFVYGRQSFEGSHHPRAKESEHNHHRAL